MTHPAVYILSIGVAVGFALYAFFSNAPQYDRANAPHSPNRSNPNKTLDFDYVDDSRDCTICISKITYDLVYLDCGHAFHKRCIRRWLSTNDTCPNCKKIQRKHI